MARRVRTRKPTPAERRAKQIVETHRWKLSLLRKFVTKHGWSELRRGTVVPPGVDLFTYVHRRRYEYRTDQIAHWLVAACEAVPGWSWTPIQDRQRRNIDNIRRFVQRHGWDGLYGTRIDGVTLSQWAGMRRTEYRRGELDMWIIRALEAIPGWSWEPLEHRNARNLIALRGYIARHGWTDLDAGTIAGDGSPIGNWVGNLRRAHRRKGGVPKWLVSAVETIPGWIWDPRTANGRRRAAILRAFVEKHGWDEVKDKLVVRGVSIGKWLDYCRRSHAHGSLSADTVAALEAIPGFRWDRAPARRRYQRDGAGRFSATSRGAGASAGRPASRR